MPSFGIRHSAQNKSITKIDITHICFLALGLKQNTDSNLETLEGIAEVKW